MLNYYITLTIFQILLLRPKKTQKRLFVRYCWNLESMSPMLSLCYYVILIYRKYHCWTLQPVKCLLSKGQVSQLDNLFLCELITNRYLPE